MAFGSFYGEIEISDLVRRNHGVCPSGWDHHLRSNTPCYFLTITFGMHPDQGFLDRTVCVSF
jgi:hypothetical protein